MVPIVANLNRNEAIGDNRKRRSSKKKKKAEEICAQWISYAGPTDKRCTNHPSPLPPLESDPPKFLCELT